jgi:energy-coupling factor transport system substrate-specific component
MEKQEKKQQFSIKFFLALAFCLLVRLIPFRVPNVEPILATMMPFSKALGAISGFSFAVLSILLYDILTGTLGMQTFFTAGAYGLLGIGAALYFKKYGTEKWSFVRFAIIGTLFFDALTGLVVGPTFFHQSFVNALIGQIPFTILHLLGNIIFALLLSPAIYKILIKKKKREPDALSIKNLQPKII